MMNRQISLFEQLKGLNLPAGDFAIFGSGPLIVRGIIPASNDLDILCRRQAWLTVQELGELEYLTDYGVKVLTMCDGQLTFGEKWGIGEFGTDDLIDCAEVIDGLPFVRLIHVVSYKRISKRPKDLEHLEALEAWNRTLISQNEIQLPRHCSRDASQS